MPVFYCRGPQWLAHKSSDNALHTYQFQVKDQQTFNSLAFTCITLDTVAVLVNWSGQITFSSSEKNAYTFIFYSYITRQAIILDLVL